MHPIGCFWSCEKCGKGCICAHGKKKSFFTRSCDQCHCLYWVRVGCNVMPVSGLSLLGGLHWPSIRQSLCVSQSSVTACGLPKDSASSLISASPSSAEASESRSKHDWTHRVGSRRRLVLETACSDPPTDAQRNHNAHALSCTNFMAIVGVRQFVTMVACEWAWFIACSAHFVNSEVKELASKLCNSLLKILNRF